MCIVLPFVFDSGLGWTVDTVWVRKDLRPPVGCHVTLQVKDLTLLEMVIQNQYLLRYKTRFYWVKLDL